MMCRDKTFNGRKGWWVLRVKDGEVLSAENFDTRKWARFAKQTRQSDATSKVKDATYVIVRNFVCGGDCG